MSNCPIPPDAPDAPARWRRVCGAVLALAAASVLTGCAQLGQGLEAPPPPLVASASPVPLCPPVLEALSCVPPPEVDDPADAAARHALAYHDRIRLMARDDLNRELVRIGTPADPQATIELALLVTQLRGNGDTARALGLLDMLQHLSTPDAAPWQPMARLLTARLAEQRRQEEQLDRQAQQLRDSQKRIDQMNQQIEALKAIERSLNARAAGLVPPTLGAASGASAVSANGAAAVPAPAKATAPAMKASTPAAKPPAP